MEDWKIEVEFKHSWDLDEALGTCRTDLARKTATISMVHPEEQIQRDEDPEETLVHEILHLLTAGFHHPAVGRLGGGRLSAMEQMVDLVSIALVRLRRGKRGKK